MKNVICINYLISLAMMTVTVLVSSSAASAQHRVVQAIHADKSVPFAFRQGDGPSEGMVIDLCEAIARDNSWEIEFKSMIFADLLPAVAAGEADMICTAMSYTPERATQVNFTPSWYEAGEGMVVLKADTTAYKTWTEVKDQPVGAPKGTTYYAALEKTGVFADLKAYDNIQAGLSAVASGEIKAFFTLKPIQARVLSSGFPDLRLVESYQPSVVGASNLAVRKGDADLLAAVNASLAKLAADGTIRTLKSKWGL
ncbi:MAG: ABC transporter substrate-binding protein [Paracoccaceae bacterium]|nr:ABC transporter substrate-binding protein [Paracoccaceae bacterium]